MTQEKETERQRLWRHFKAIATRENAPDYRMTIEELFIRAAKHHGATSDARAREDAAKYNAACHEKGANVIPPLYMCNYLAWLEAPPVNRAGKGRVMPKPIQPGTRILRDLTVQK